ncbi:MAG: hypothetical protein A4E30_00206 [Methanomassiliicoccales archaeon PtaB.Bin215]|nr:MAG: hypothetical protein A4E30_00206 [Methanomassiliicoccales archaeon PtaB.Bin215]
MEDLRAVNEPAPELMAETLAGTALNELENGAAVNLLTSGRGFISTFVGDRHPVLEGEMRGRR